MQSNLPKILNNGFKLSERLTHTLQNFRNMAINNSTPLPWGPITRQRLVRTTLLYACVYVGVLLLMEFSDSARLHALATGLLIPGSGFLYWANPAGATNLWFVGLTALAMTVFAIGMVLWFATGNIIAPILAWLAGAVAAALVTEVLPAAVVVYPWPLASQFIKVLTPLIVVLAFVAKAGRAQKESAQYQRFCKASPLPVIEDNYSTAATELSLQDIQKMRALLDRSLQPVNEFEGFDWLDQFQTASLRYQINFVSYALSVASQVHLPAAETYMQLAQQNLAEKLLDPRVWGYWRLENMWGNFSTNADPIPRDNIMLSGFLSAQFGLARRLVSMTNYDGVDSVVFKTRSGQEFRYSLEQISRELKRQYQCAPYGLLACEPNWVFPLCNSITALGMRTLDVQLGTSHWDDIADRFRESLDTEFTSPGGLLVPFRSSRTGIAAPMIGGGAMQSFPCLFLNSLLPDVAAQQWQLTRENLTEASGRRALWPVDIGNYRFNRSASYSACAAVAVEMGDTDTANRLLNFLDEDYPMTIEAGVAHRPKCSLWSHALEFMARAGDVNALRAASNSKRPEGPVITKANYPDVLLASAKSDGQCLKAVMYPGDRSGSKSLTVGGLVPNRVYRVDADQRSDLTADRNGEALIEIFVADRTELTISPHYSWDGEHIA